MCIERRYSDSPVVLSGSGSLPFIFLKALSLGFFIWEVEITSLYNFIALVSSFGSWKFVLRWKCLWIRYLSVAIKVMVASVAFGPPREPSFERIIML